MKRKHTKVRSRNEAFAEKTATRIWKEKPAEHNPYIAEECYCHGYNLLDLMDQCSFVEVTYLLLRGELPSANEKVLLNALMVALINPGPRHPATRAAMTVAVSKTDVAHILPISLGILSGSHLGAGEIEPAMRFLRKNLRHEPEQVVERLINEVEPPAEGDWHIAPGFGTRFGGIDILPGKIAQKLTALPASGKTMRWGCAFATKLETQGHGWLSTGIAAAVFSDLGFQPRAGAALFQLISAPGLLAHAIELANKPITAMPMVDDQHYVIES